MWLQSLFDLWVDARQQLAALRNKRVVTPSAKAAQPAAAPADTLPGVQVGLLHWALLHTGTHAHTHARTRTRTCMHVCSLVHA